MPDYRLCLTVKRSDQEKTEKWLLKYIENMIIDKENKDTTTFKIENVPEKLEREIDQWPWVLEKYRDFKASFGI